MIRMGIERRRSGGGEGVEMMFRGMKYIQMMMRKRKRREEANVEIKEDVEIGDIELLGTSDHLVYNQSYQGHNSGERVLFLVNDIHLHRYEIERKKMTMTMMY